MFPWKMLRSARDIQAVTMQRREMTSESLPQRDSNQILAERLRFVASAVLILFLVGWCLWFYPYDDLLDRSGTPLGADYSMFYVAGQTVLVGAGDQLYDQDDQQRRLQNLFPNIDPQSALPYRYPPFVALLMAPLAALPYVASFAVFSALSFTAWYLGLWVLTAELRISAGGNRRLICLAFAGWPVALETMIGGQASMFGLLILAMTIVLANQQRYAVAGAMIALAAYKPNLLLLVAAGLLLYRPRMLRGLLPAATVIAGLCLLTVGWKGTVEYMHVTMQLATGPWEVETPFWKVHGLAPWIGLVVGNQARLVTLLAGLLATVAVAWRWRRSGDPGTTTLAIALALLITVNALANVYLPIYDLTLLAIGGLLTIASLAARDGFDPRGHLAWSQLLLATIFFGPHLSQLIASQIGLQCFALALLGVGIWQARIFWDITRATAPVTQLSGWVSDGPSP